MSDEQAPLQIKRAGDAVSVGESEAIELWRYGTYASAWFADALKEAKGQDDQAKCREIIFAVCAAESYLVEWVRDAVLGGEFRLLDGYFPLEDRRMGIGDRWKQVIKRLYEDSRISGKPEWGRQYWSEFVKLVNFRNGLLHGRASRPDTEGLPENVRLEPTVEQLAQRRPGWATETVANLIRELHMATGTAIPSWLTS